MTVIKFLEHYAHYQTGKTLPKGFSCTTIDDRETTVLYAWNNGDCWLLAKPGETYNTENVSDLNSLLAANPERKSGDTVNLYILEPGTKTESLPLPDGYCRRLLNENDAAAFEVFHAACPTDDKEEGQVAMDDDLVYGILCGDQLVAVASLWHWGDHIADIGVLTHPDFRRKGLMKVAVEGIAANTDRILLWRAGVDNTGSNKTANSCGFQPVGSLVSIIG